MSLKNYDKYFDKDILIKTAWNFDRIKVTNFAAG